MKIFNKVFITIFSVLAVFGLTSCENDGKFDVDLYVYCTSDMLEYVIPTVELTINGETITKTLSVSDFEEGGGHVNNTDYGVEEDLHRYSFHDSFDVDKIVSTVSVSYKLRPHATFTKKYYYFANLVRLAYTHKDRGLSNIYNYDIDETMEYVERSQAEEFLEDFCSKKYEKTVSIETK